MDDILIQSGFRLTERQLEMLDEISRKLGSPGNKSAALRFVLDDYARTSGYNETKKEAA